LLGFASWSSEMLALRFVASFVLISLPLTWLWFEGAAAGYGWILHHVGGEIYSLAGFDGMRTLYRARFINFIPFIALVLATPRLNVRRRVIGLLAGIALLFASHLLFNGMAELSRTSGLMPPVAATFSDALPLALWAVVARHFIADVTRSIAAPLPGPESTDESG
jgi:hypothetical protein